MAAVTFLLPAAGAFGAQRLRGPGAEALGRADAMPRGEAGRQAQLLRHFELLPRRWPIAALSRQADAGDAAGSAWLRADPAWVRPDINGARLLACGDDLRMTDADSAALLPALRPLFGDAGFPIDAPHPSRWYLRLPLESKFPEFPPPAEAIGTDLADQLDDDTPAARRWRALLTEAQIVLHNHPWNERRAAGGLTPVNSLWLWGGGVLPDHVGTGHGAVATAEEELQALVAASGAQAVAPLQAFDPVAVPSLVDLRTLRDLRAFADDWLAPALSGLSEGRLKSLLLDLEDGTGYRLSRGQRWRFWRRPRDTLAQ